MGAAGCPRLGSRGPTPCTKGGRNRGHLREGGLPLAGGLLLLLLRLLPLPLRGLLLLLLLLLLPLLLLPLRGLLLPLLLPLRGLRGLRLLRLLLPLRGLRGLRALRALRGMRALRLLRGLRILLIIVVGDLGRGWRWRTVRQATHLQLRLGLASIRNGVRAGVGRVGVRVGGYILGLHWIRPCGLDLY